MVTSERQNKHTSEGTIFIASEEVALWREDSLVEGHQKLRRSGKAKCKAQHSTHSLNQKHHQYLSAKLKQGRIIAGVHRNFGVRV